MVQHADIDHTGLTGVGVPTATFNDHSARHENGGADEISLAGLDGTPTELTNHLGDTADAHDASAISFTPAGSIAATDVQAAIEEVAAEAGATAYIVRAAGTSVAAGDYLTWLVLAANSGDITGTTLTTVMTITGVGAGRYHYYCYLVTQSSATGTGQRMQVAHTGTTTQFLAERRYPGIGTAAANGAQTGANSTSTGNVYEGWVTRTNDGLIGATSVSVDTADADLPSVIEGFMVVSVSGDLQIKLAAESAVLVVRAMQGSFLELKKLS